MAKAASSFVRKACKRLVVFDFDLTLVDCITEKHIFPILTGGKDIPATWFSGDSWLECLNSIFDGLHSHHSVKPDDYRRSLRQLPFVPGVAEMIATLASQPDHRLMVLSDSNKVFIETALEAKKFKHHFHYIITNHGDFDQKGRLRMSPVKEQAARATSGSCPSGDCASNLCKGSEIARLLKEFEEHDPEIWYVGDGPNDWCAAIGLPSDKHHVFAREGFTLHAIVSDALDNRSSSKLKCNASFWKDGFELMDCMAKLDPSLKRAN